MKTTLLKRIGMFSWPLVALQPGYATTVQQDAMQLPLLHHAVYTLRDSLVAKSITTTTTPNIPLQAPAKAYTAAYLNEHDVLLNKIKVQNSKSFTLIRNLLEQQGLPQELLYIAVVESKMKNTATSGDGAAGIWQLMPATARTLGLKINTQVDQRRNIHQSTIAAARYLNSLYKEFNDWLLVVAAYNCGSGNVHKAIKNAGSRDFWKLQRFLPKESSNHVKRFIATHFYYEQKGSIVTLTKEEHKQYIALQEEEEQKAAQDLPTSPLPQERKVIPVNWVLLKEENGEWHFMLRR